MARHICAAMICFLLAAALPAVAGQETEIAGVSAAVEFLRQYDGLLHLGIRLTNTSGAAARAGSAIQFAKVALVDESSAKKIFALKDPQGRYLAGPVSDWNDGGRWWAEIPARSDLLLWFLFDGVTAGSVFTVNVPLMFPFEDVPVTEGSPASAMVGGADPPLKAALISATRAKGQLKVKLKLANPGKTKAEGHAVYYADAYVVDPKGKRIYPVLKDSAGVYQAQPMSDNDKGGRTWTSFVEPGGSMLMALTFQAPPDDVARADIILPRFEPFEAVPMAGEGGAAAGGMSVAGATRDLTGILKELKAVETAKEIKVQLAADLLFDFDKADIKKEAETALVKVGAVLATYPAATVLVEGHTDAKGDDSYNQTLSEKRAAAVAAWLAAKGGADSKRTRAVGWGELRPIEANSRPDGADNPAGRAKNRRVEITVFKP